MPSDLRYSRLRGLPAVAKISAPDLPGDLDGRQAHAAGGGVDQHALARLRLAQPAQGQLGGEEADGDGGRFLES